VSLLPSVALRISTTSVAAIRIRADSFAEALLRRQERAGDAAMTVPAAEHSTITSWGREHEVDAIRNLLHIYPTGIVAAPMDSYNVYEACEHILGTC
jgi:nicotinic acid phosphoribosyltransferase